MSIAIEPTVLRDFERSSRLEWLETNGLGGWAMSTVAGAHSRRYHGLLVAATRPPVERMVLLSRLDETVRSGGRAVELGAARFPGAVHPHGFERLRSFERGLFPVWEYDLEGVVESGRGERRRGAVLRKTVAAVWGENTVAVRYELVGGPKGRAAAAAPVELELRPMFAARGYHQLGTAERELRREATLDGDVLRYRAQDGVPEVQIRVPGAAFEAAPDWWRRFELVEELERGFDGHEDLFLPGVVRVTLPASGRLGVVISILPAAGRDAEALVAAEARRRRRLVARVRRGGAAQARPAPSSPRALAPAGAGAATRADSAVARVPGGSGEGAVRDLLAQLTLAADQFLVRRGEHDTTVIAGYPWFTDWGRDTMISLPGLCLTTGRHREAKGILRAFAAAIDRGMVPNRFPDGAEEPEYNTVDATLWLFVAIRRYLDATGDLAFVRRELMPVLEEILVWHRRGTRHGIVEDGDGLLRSGEAGVQLTWMDARVGDWVVTPRRGKPVEIQALWYNALRILADLRERCGDTAGAASLEVAAERARRRFVELFWNAERGCLLDCVEQRDGEAAAGLDDRVRPNQVLALSLPYELLDRERAASVLAVVEAVLATPYGLRSLEPGHPDYRPCYQGGPVERDGAYHQGVVWSWLLGPLATAMVRVRGEEGRRQARALVLAAAAHLAGGCVGSVSEIFDAEPPFAPRGCPAQAWGVAEWLRAAVEEAGIGALAAPAAAGGGGRGGSRPAARAVGGARR